MMNIAAEQRHDEKFTLKLLTVLESHFDEVIADFEGQIGHFMVNHPSRGRMIIDSIGRKVVKADDDELANFGVELLSHL